MAKPSGFQNQVLPPRQMRLVDDEAFVRSGDKQVEFISKLTEFRPDQRVLDVGCGAGRHAIAFTRMLDPGKGSYTGLDVSEEKIRWCDEHIAATHPNFRFLHLPTFSPYFNQAGTEGGVRLPLEANSFDLIMFWSVMSHVLPHIARPYLHETSRLLITGGHAVVSAYFWDGDTPDELAAGTPRFTFAHDYGTYRAHRDDIHEWALAYPEELFRSWIEDAGLVIAERRRGDWRSRPTQNQDVLVLRRMSQRSTST